MANRVSETINIVTMGRAGKAGMSPFRGLRLIRVTRYFNQEEGGVYGEGLKKICRQTGAHRLLPSLRRPHGSGVGARTRFLRLALRELRRTDRSGDSRPSSASCRACRIRETSCRPQSLLKELTSTLAGPDVTCVASTPRPSPLDCQIGAHLAMQMMFSHPSGSLRRRIRRFDAGAVMCGAGELSATFCYAPAAHG